MTALVVAIVGGLTDTVKALLDRGADVNRRTRNGLTPLMIAAAKGYTDIVDILLKNGADVNARSENGFTAVMISDEKGYPNIAKLIKNDQSKVGVYVSTISYMGDIYTVTKDIHSFCKNISEMGQGGLEFNLSDYQMIQQSIYDISGSYFEKSKYKEAEWDSQVICAKCSNIIHRFGGMIEDVCNSCGSNKAVNIYNSTDGKIKRDDIKYIRNFFRDKAKHWWSKMEEDDNCDSCVQRISKGDGYLVNNNMLCEKCCKIKLSYLAKTSIEDRAEFPGLLRKSRKYNKNGILEVYE